MSTRQFYSSSILCVGSPEFSQSIPFLLTISHFPSASFESTEQISFPFPGFITGITYGYGPIPRFEFVK